MATGPARAEPLAPPLPAVPPLASSVTPPAPPSPPAPEPPEGPLSGLIVILSPGHGRMLHISVDGHTPLTWDYQRDPSHGLQEDVWTLDFVADHLAPVLRDRGATVLSLRSLDRHAVAALVDDADPGFEAPPAVTVQALGSHGDGHTLLYPEAEATFTLTVPDDPAPGPWHLATRWVSHPDLSREARYEITAGDTQAVVEVDQTRHGGVWWPLGAWDLSPGDTVTVRLTGAGVRSADAVRLGGGTFTLEHPLNGRTYEVPLHEVATVHQLDHLGGPEHLRTLDDGRLASDGRVRARWASWATEPDDEAVFLSLHTNAGRGHGSWVFVSHDPDVTPPLPVQPRSRAVAEAVSDALRRTLRTVSPTWRHRGVWRQNLSEVSPHWNRVDGALVELGFHDSRHDVRWLTDPAFLHAAAEALADGLQAWRDDPDTPSTERLPRIGP